MADRHEAPTSEAKPRYFVIDEERLRKLRELGLVPDFLYTYLASKIEQPFNQTKNGQQRRTRLKPKEFCERWDMGDRQYRRARKKLEEVGLWDGIDLEIDLLVRDPETLSDKVINLNRTKVSATGQKCPQPDRSVHSRTEVSTAGQKCPQSDKSVQGRSPEPFPEEASSDRDFFKTFKTSLNLTNTDNPNRVCKKEGFLGEEVEDQESRFRPTSQVKSAIQSTPQPKALIEDKFSADPEILQKMKNLGVRVEDKKLRQAIATYPDRLPSAVAALVEKAQTVKYPTRFLEKAILEAWEPEKKQSLEFSQWFDAARLHDCGVVGAQFLDGVQWVLDYDGNRHRWDELKDLPWDALRQKLKSSPPMEEFVEEAVDLSDLLVAIDCEIRRLRWDGDQVKDFLLQVFEKPRRSQLTDAQIVDLLELLQAEEVSYV